MEELEEAGRGRFSAGQRWDSFSRVESAEPPISLHINKTVVLSKMSAVEWAAGSLAAVASVNSGQKKVPFSLSCSFGAFRGCSGGLSAGNSNGNKARRSDTSRGLG